MAQKPSIFINPKFKNIHVNPNFLQPQKVLINPKFFVGANFVTNLPVDPPLPVEIVEKPPLPPLPPAPGNAIIRNTRRTLIRGSSSSSRPMVAIPAAANPPLHTLIKVSKNKLVTAAHLMKCQQKENAIIKSTTESIIKSKKLKRETEKPPSIYKFDRRNPKKKKIVSTYSIRRISPKKAQGQVLKT
jgi:hypothetical protein